MQARHDEQRVCALLRIIQLISLKDRIVAEPILPYFLDYKGDHIEASELRHLNSIALSSFRFLRSVQAFQISVIAAISIGWVAPATAQRSSENAVTAADDAFG